MNNTYNNKQIEITQNEQYIISNYTKKITIKSLDLSKINKYTKKIIIPNSVNYLNVYLQNKKIIIIPNSVKNHTIHNMKKAIGYNSKIILHCQHRLFTTRHDKYHFDLNKSMKNITNVVFIHTLKTNKLRNLFHINNILNLYNILRCVHDKINNKYLCNYTYLIRCIKNIDFDIHEIYKYCFLKNTITIVTPKIIGYFKITIHTYGIFCFKIINKCYLSHFILNYGISVCAKHTDNLKFIFNIDNLVACVNKLEILCNNIHYYNIHVARCYVNNLALKKIKIKISDNDKQKLCCVKNLYLVDK